MPLFSLLLFRVEQQKGSKARGMGESDKDYKMLAKSSNYKVWGNLAKSCPADMGTPPVSSSAHYSGVPLPKRPPQPSKWSPKNSSILQPSPTTCMEDEEFQQDPALGSQQHSPLPARSPSSSSSGVPASPPSSLLSHHKPCSVRPAHLNLLR